MSVVGCIWAIRHAVEDLLIPDESAWYAMCFWPAYQNMTHVYMNPQANMSCRHTLNRSDQNTVTPSPATAIKQTLQSKSQSSFSCWHMYVFSLSSLSHFFCLFLALLRLALTLTYIRMKTLHCQCRFSELKSCIKQAFFQWIPPTSLLCNFHSLSIWPGGLFLQTPSPSISPSSLSFSLKSLWGHVSQSQSSTYLHAFLFSL